MGDIVKKNENTMPMITTQDVEARMIVLRKQPVLIDADVAELYGVETKRVNEQREESQAAAWAIPSRDRGRR